MPRLPHSRLPRRCRFQRPFRRVPEFGQSELLLSVVENELIRLDLIGRMGGGRLGDEIDFGARGAGDEHVGRRLERLVDGLPRQVASAALSLRLVLRGIVGSCVVSRLLWSWCRFRSGGQKRGLVILEEGWPLLR
jgi:hypothetical protein